MSNEYKGLIVTFEKDLTENSVEKIINAIKMLKGVIDVSESVTDAEDYMNRCRVKYELRNKLYKAFEEE